MGRSEGSGNAAWKASRRMSQCKPGNINRRECCVVRKDGTKCHGIAVTGFGRCFHHGGSGFLALRGLYRRKLRYSAWTLPRSQLKSEDQLKAEAKAKMALWDFPEAKGG